MSTLQGVARSYKEALLERYKMGFAKDAHDYMKSTWKTMSDLDWALMGADTVAPVESFKEEALTEAQWLQDSPSKKVPKIQAVIHEEVIE